MSIELAEQLKSELTDKYVVVDPSIAELKRFAPFTGMVKTVNMNGQALVQFDGPEDISWYDIHPQFLTVVDAPQPKDKAAPAKPAAKEQPATATTPAATPAAKPAAGMSPIELARAQGAAKAGGAKPKPATAKPVSAEPTKGMSPLELARQQGAAGSQPAAARKPADSGKKLSPLELARQQDGGSEAKPPVEAPKAEAAAPESAPSPEPPAEKPAPVVASGEALSTDEILALCRQQGPFKG